LGFYLFAVLIVRFAIKLSNTYLWRSFRHLGLFTKIVLFAELGSQMSNILVPPVPWVGKWRRWGAQGSRK
jgi:hypothetical protein